LLPRSGVPPAGSPAIRCSPSHVGTRGHRWTPQVAVTRAEWAHPFPSRTRSCNAPAPTILAGRLAGTIGRCRPLRRGVEQWQLVGLITRRSPVRIRPPLPTRRPRHHFWCLGRLADPVRWPLGPLRDAGTRTRAIKHVVDCQLGQNMTPPTNTCDGDLQWLDGVCVYALSDGDVLSSGLLVLSCLTEWRAVSTADFSAIDRVRAPGGRAQDPALWSEGRPGLWRCNALREREVAGS
jgi:hypothetical protein